MKKMEYTNPQARIMRRRAAQDEFKDDDGKPNIGLLAQSVGVHPDTARWLLDNPPVDPSLDAEERTAAERERVVADREKGDAESEKRIDAETEKANAERKKAESAAAKDADKDSGKTSGTTAQRK